MDLRTIGELEREAFVRSGYRCEQINKTYTNTFKEVVTRCPEKHLEPAVTYKGRVVLKPYPLIKRPQCHKDIAIYCNHCHTKAVEGGIKNQKPRQPKKHQVNNQGSLL